MVQSLGRYGSPEVREGTQPIRAGLLARLRSWLRGDTTTLYDWLERPTRDDNFQPCVVDFGAPPAATLRTADGHPILWLQLPASAEADLPSLLEAVAGTRAVRETDLDWQVMA